jgi:hypothetical protein
MWKELLAERGLRADHVTGVAVGTAVRARNLNEVCARGSRRPTTVGRVGSDLHPGQGQVDSSGATIDFLLSAKRDEYFLFRHQSSDGERRGPGAFCYPGLGIGRFSDAARADP